MRPPRVSGEAVARRRRDSRPCAAQVTEMQSQMETLISQMYDANTEVSELLKVVEREELVIAKTKQELRQEETSILHRTQRAQEIADSAKSALDKAMPALREAERLLSALNKKDIAELKSHRRPPSGMTLTIQAMCIILERKPKRVEASKMMGSEEHLPLLEPKKEAPPSLSKSRFSSIITKVRDSITQEPGEEEKDKDKDTAKKKPGAAKINIRELLTGRRMVDDYWPVAKDLFSDVHFLQILTSVTALNATIVEKLQPYIDSPQFTPAAVGKVSIACKSICQWIHAMVEYHKTKTDIVKPKEQEFAVANEQLRIQKLGLEKQREALRAVEDKLQALQNQHDEAMQKQASLTEKVENSKKQVQRAVRLLAALSGETERWRVTLRELHERQLSVVGDAVLAAAQVTYLGPYASKTRQDLLMKWKERARENGLPVSEDCSLENFWLEKGERDEWRDTDLPADPLAMSNAIIMQRSARWPLLLDPQRQASNWLKHIGELTPGTAFLQQERRMLVTSTESMNLDARVKLAMTEGHTLLVELPHRRSSFSALLMTLVLQFSTPTNFEQAREDVIVVPAQGEEERPTEVSMDKNFRVIFACSDASSVVIQGMAECLNLIDFSITPEGLVAQLLTIVTARERPELAEEHLNLEMAISTCRKQMGMLEERVLELVSASGGSILDDDELIDLLSQSTTTFNEVKVQMLANEVFSKELESTREMYRAVANRVALLYFCIMEMCVVQPLYQYSLSVYLMYFRSALEGTVDWAEDSRSLEKRLIYLNDKVTNALYSNLCRCLMERHRLVFALKVGVQIQIEDGKISADEWHFFLDGAESNSSSLASLHSVVGKAGTTTKVPKREELRPQWLPVSRWTALMQLCKIPAFLRLCFASKDRAHHPLTNNSHAQARWKQLYEHEEIERQPLPGEWESALSPFQKLLLLRCLQPHRLTAAVTVFVEETLGPQYIEIPPIDIGPTFMESTPLNPVMCIYSQGITPAEEIIQFARRSNMFNSTIVLSMGRDQGPRATAAIKVASETGQWVLLQNCHLATDWMPELVKLLALLEEGPKPSHPKFRLWITLRMTQSEVPSCLVESSVRFILEAPKDLRSSMLRTVEEVRSSAKPLRSFNLVMLRVALFHGIVMTRGKYGLGWAQPYDFNRTEFSMAKMALTTYLERVAHTTSSKEKEELALAQHSPAEYMHYVIGELAYGGRVYDEETRSMLKMLLIDCLFMPLSDPQVCRKNVTMEELYDHQGRMKSEFYEQKLYDLGADSFKDALSTYCPLNLMAPEGVPLNLFSSHIKTKKKKHELPEIFGLHGSADIRHMLQEASSLVTSIGDIERNTLSHAAGQPVQSDSPFINSFLVLKVASEIELKLPQIFDVEPLRQELQEVTVEYRLQHMGGSGSSVTAKDLTPRDQSEDKTAEKKELESRKRLNLKDDDLPWMSHQKEKALLPDPLGFVLLQECQRSNHVLHTVRDSIGEVRRALKGQVVMSENIEGICHSFITGNVPELWLKRDARMLSASRPAHAPTSLAVWILRLRKAADFFHKWLAVGVDGVRKPPPVMHLPAFHYPLSMLAAVVQGFHRQSGVTLDCIQFKTQVMTEEPLGEAPYEGVYLGGLYLEGARWDSHGMCLEESHHTETQSPMHVIWLKPEEVAKPMEPGLEEPGLPTDRIPLFKSARVDRDNMSLTTLKHGHEELKMYPCPLYKTGMRSEHYECHKDNFVLTVHLDPGTHRPQHWVKRSVALICLD
ncbi:hypothetical protein CYMTET_28529 [Cymbomonas tetramitiformis]|uniref:Uncharacterized protein n=1 Tax=Cymbomonas tetramitiformis TaxID=36881 RepID=A0AAE0KW50_9CHLO|nr:hypothetical protein CYMTET_28529 [Cymbomonas tetramitiformis]